jgi:inhibitor of KinA
MELLAKQSLLPFFETMCSQLKQAADACTVAPTKSKSVQVPVCYAVSMAPDIESVAALHSLDVDEVIQLHTAKTYRVYMIGFLPGFAYMGSVDEKIVTPRRSQPRTQVPAGSVGIAGEQTGIYPFDSPGGWQLIGQTPLEMFNMANEMPCYLQPGDEVQFYPITMAEFEKIKKA